MHILAIQERTSLEFRERLEKAMQSGYVLLNSGLALGGTHSLDYWWAILKIDE